MTVSQNDSTLRTYDDSTQERVKTNYREARTNQTLSHVMKLRKKYGTLTTPIGVWDAMDKLKNFVDLSDPDVKLPNIIHLYQTAEGIRSAGLPDWLQLVGLLHDLGKILYIKGCDEEGTSMESQWSLVGDSFIVGCALPDSLVFPHYNALHGDSKDPLLNTPLGIYQEGCGLDNCFVSYGHDEYLYEVLSKNDKVTLPEEALYIIRYHSLYAWHTENDYKNLESKHDRAMKGWVRLFNGHDLYTKHDQVYTTVQLDHMHQYYDTLIKKYLPEELMW